MPRYQSVGDDGSGVASELLRKYRRFGVSRLDSDVLLDRMPSIPKPAVAVSFSSGRISPKSKPLEREEVGLGDVCGGRCDVDFDACSFADIEARGWFIRLAKD